MTLKGGQKVRGKTYVASWQKDTEEKAVYMQRKTEQPSVFEIPIKGRLAAAHQLSCKTLLPQRRTPFRTRTWEDLWGMEETIPVRPPV